MAIKDERTFLQAPQTEITGLQREVIVATETENRLLKEQNAAAEALIIYLLHQKRRERSSREQEYIDNDDFRRRQQIVIERLLKEARTDKMTGLLDKQSFYDAAEEMHRELGSEDVLLMVDIDDFKAKNSRFGHIQADQVLVVVADELQSKIRSTDLAGSWAENQDPEKTKTGRYGGEEFAAVLPNAKSEEIIKKFTVDESGKFRLNITVRLKVQGSEEYVDEPVTVSGAVTNWMQGENFMATMERVNAKMNEIKKSGEKNRIEII